MAKLSGVNPVHGGGHSRICSRYCADSKYSQKRYHDNAIEQNPKKAKTRDFRTLFEEGEAMFDPQLGGGGGEV